MKFKFSEKTIYLSLLIFLPLSIFLSWNIGKKLAEKEFNQKALESTKLAGDWFDKIQTKQGDFIYEIDTKTGKTKDGNNIVRQAGSLYGLAQVYRLGKSEQDKKTLEKGYKYFQNYLQENSVQNNAKALLLVSLIEFMQADSQNQKIYLSWAKELANYLVTTQLDNGGFSYHGLDGDESDYNNGETFYALMRMNDLQADEDYLLVSQKAADYFIVKYGKDKFVNLSFFSWGMAGFAYLYQQDSQSRYWQFMKQSTDKFINSYKVNQPKGNLGVYIEGISHVAWIAKEQDKNYYSQLKNFSKDSLIYLLSLQLDGPLSKRHSSFDNLKGSFCYDYICNSVRIDIVHHITSALFLYLTKVI